MNCRLAFYLYYLLTYMTIKEGSSCPIGSTTIAKTPPSTTDGTTARSSLTSSRTGSTSARSTTFVSTPTEVQPTPAQWTQPTSAESISTSHQSTRSVSTSTGSTETTNSSSTSKLSTPLTTTSATSSREISTADQSTKPGSTPRTKLSEPTETAIPSTSDHYTVSVSSSTASSKSTLTTSTSAATATTSKVIVTSKHSTDHSTATVSTSTASPESIGTTTTREMTTESTTKVTSETTTPNPSTKQSTTAICATDATPSTDSPTIVSRADWGAKPPTQALGNLPVPVANVIVHHTAGKECKCKKSCSKVVKEIQNYHMSPKPDGNGWWDIGYNFLIGGDGKVYEGRGWDKKGAHAGAEFNDKSIGIAMIGTFTNKMPTQAALDALDDLIALGVASGKLNANYVVKGHRDVSATECPGNTFYTNHVKNMKNYKQ